jgi:hypothetical protein
MVKHGGPSVVGLTRGIDGICEKLNFNFRNAKECSKYVEISDG